MWEGLDCVEEGRDKVTFSLVAPDNSDPTLRHNGFVGEVNEGTPPPSAIAAFAFKKGGRKSG